KEIIKIIKINQLFLIRTFSFLRFADNKSINLKRFNVIKLKVVTITYIKLKLITDHIKASLEKTKLNLVISASNNFATKTETNCDKPIPINIPVIKEIIPTKIVSRT